MPGGADFLDDDESSNLPIEAFSSTSSDFPEICDFWLLGADTDQQITAMRVWFHKRFVNPVDVVGIIAKAQHEPANSSPAEVINHRFGKYASPEARRAIVEELRDEAGDGWACRPEPLIYDEAFGIDVENPKDPYTVLERRLGEIEEILTLTGSLAATALAQRLAYSNVITALESFLWETLTYAVDNDEKVLRNIVTKIPALRDQQMKLGEIFEKQATLNEIVKGYLQNLVWHRWDDVAKLLKYGLEIDPPPFKAFVKATVTRHDIVHRSGHDRDGNPVAIDRAEIEGLIDDVREFALILEGEMIDRYVSEQTAAIEADFSRLDELESAFAAEASTSSTKP